jgi:tRNA pseudouridine synthase 10
VVVFESPPSPGQLAHLNQLKDLQLHQKTPLRVLHRRTLMTRMKVIHRAKIELISERVGVLLVLASAGTYIKEFVHGDLGRTVPSVGTLTGVDCDILQLDVVGLYEGLDETALLHF